jgi:hypothetical protein
MSVQLPTCVIHIELRQRHAVRTRDRDEYVIDLGRNLREEPPQPIEVRRVERGDAGCELEAGAMHALGVASRDDHGSSLAVGAPRGLEPDARAATDHEDRLTVELGFATHAAANFAVGQGLRTRVSP